MTYHVGLGGSLHGDLGIWVNLDAGIKNTVRNLIADLVGVTLADRLRSEVNVALFVTLHLNF